MASNGIDFLVVWQSKGAARVTAPGELLDTPSLLLPQPEFDTDTDVVWDGSEYLVGWSVFQHADGIVDEPGGLYFATVSTAGEVRRSSLHIATERIRQGSRFRLARIGSVLAGACELEPAGTVATTLFRRTGTIIRTLRFNSFSFVDLASNGRQFALLLDRSMVVFSAEGEIVREVSFPENVSPLDVVGNGDGFFVLAAERGTERDHLQAIRIASDGSEVSTTVVLESGERLYYAAASSSGEEFVIAWKSTRSKQPFPGVDVKVDLWGAHLSDSGQLIEKTLIAPRTDIHGRWTRASPLDIATNGTRALLSWAQFDLEAFFASRVMAMSLRATLDGPRITVSTKANHQRLEAVAANGANFLVFWLEESALRAGRLTPSGQTLDGEGIVVTTGAASFSAAFDGQATVVLWTDETGIHGTRVGLDGSVLAPAFRVTTGRGSPAVACGDGMCLVAWTERTGAEAKLYVARIREGVVLDVNGVFVAENVAFDVASDGSSFLLVMTRVGTPGGRILSAARIAGNNAPMSVHVSDFAASPQMSAGTQVVWDGERYVVMWVEAGVTRASRLDRDGNSIDGEQTSWRGFAIADGRLGFDLTMIGNSIATSTWEELLILSRETLQVQQKIPYGSSLPVLKVFGRNDGSGLIAYSRFVEDPRYFRSVRLFFRMVRTPARSRAVRAE